MTATRADLEGPPLGVGGWIVAGLFTVSGVVHLVRPKVFEPIVPHALPAHRLLVYVSGVAELGCAAGLSRSRTRRAAGLASAALLVAVFPANVTMTVDTWHRWQAGRTSGTYLSATVLRLPLQAPLVWWAWRAGRPPKAPRARDHRP